MMSDPLSITFECLASTENQFAVDVLMSGLDVPHDEVRDRCAVALLKRKGTRGKVEVIRRYPHLNPESRVHFDTYAAQLTPALRQCLLHGDEELAANAIEIIRWTSHFEMFPVLIDLVENPDSPHYEAARQAFDELVNLVYENIHVDPRAQGAVKHLRNVSEVRRNMLTALDRACTDFAALRDPGAIVHAVLVLGDPGNFAVKKVMSQSVDACRELVGHLLMTSRHPGIMQLPLDAMSQSYPHAKIYKVIENRSDPEFICHLLRWFPRRLTDNQQKNFGQIHSVAWLKGRDLSLDMIPPGLHDALIAFVTACNLPGELKFQVQEWVVRHGSPDGRLAAAEVLSTLDRKIVHDIIFDSLDSQEEGIQAWATGQLRSQGIPEAFSLLMERLDSPLEAVQAAAREELESFNLDRMLSLFEHLPAEINRRAGELIQKIDPNCIKKLEQELRHPICRKRIRAAHAARAMGLHAKAIGSFVRMLADDDAMIRRTAVEVLADIRTKDSVKALKLALEDTSSRVRDAAKKALEQMNEPLPETPAGVQ